MPTMRAKAMRGRATLSLAVAGVVPMLVACGGALLTNNGDDSGADVSPDNSIPEGGAPRRDSGPYDASTDFGDREVSDASGEASGEADADSPDSSPAATFTVGGTIIGLQPGFGVTVQDNGDDQWPSAVVGPFTFRKPLPNGHAYDVTLVSSGEPCAVNNGVGIIAGADITNIVVQCMAYDQ